MIGGTTKVSRWKGGDDEFMTFFLLVVHDDRMNACKSGPPSDANACWGYNHEG